MNERYRGEPTHEAKIQKSWPSVCYCQRKTLKEQFDFDWMYVDDEVWAWNLVSPPVN